YFNFDTWKNYVLKSNTHGDGALYTTLEDQLHWETLLQTLKIAEPLKSLLQKSQAPIADSDFPEYGYGLEFGTYRGLDYRYHAGSTGAAKALVYRFPTEKITIFMMTNSGKCWPPYTVEAITEIVLGDHFTAPKTNRTAPKEGVAVSTEDILGTYRTSDGYYARIVQKKDGLQMERFGRRAIDVEKVGPHLTQQVDDPPFQQTFTKTEGGELEMTFYYPSHDPYSFTKVHSTVGEQDLKGIPGTYYNAETEVQVTFSFNKEGQLIGKSGQEKLSTELFEPNVLIMDGFRAELIRNEAGMVTEMLLFDKRLANLSFTRR
ncbi:MAG: hypothetical protein AAF828_12945, partial [Bacteroidota bacterium]